MTLPYKPNDNYPQLGFIKRTEEDIYFIVADKRHELYRHRFGITNMKYINDILTDFTIITLKPSVDLILINKYKKLIMDNVSEKGIRVSPKDFSGVKIE